MSVFLEALLLRDGGMFFRLKMHQSKKFLYSKQPGFVEVDNNIISFTRLAHKKEIQIYKIPFHLFIQETGIIEFFIKPYYSAS